MPMLSHVHHSSALNSAKPPSIRCGGKIVHCNVRGARATTLDSGAPINIAQGANVTGAIAASAPATISPRLCCIGARDHCRTGAWLPFCGVSPVRPGALPEKWVSISGPATAGAGGCAMPPCLIKWSAHWRARSKRMPSSTRRATKGKPNRAGRRYWGADRVGGGRSASRAGAMMTKTARRSSRGAAVRVPL